MFSNEFKTKVLRVTLPVGLGSKAVKHMENSEYTPLRYMLEDLLDDPKMYETNSKEVKPFYKTIHSMRLEAYSELMEIINDFLDNGRLLHKNRVRL